jgi:hypothetical protein
MNEPSDFESALNEAREHGGFPGGMMTRRGARNYVGVVPAIAGTLFFKDAYRPEVREAICLCFEEYERLAKDHLTWLWREEPREGPDCIAYSKAKPMRTMMKRMDEEDAVSFAYVSGKNREDAGQWEFQAHGWRQWEAKMGTWGLCVVRFSMSMAYVAENPTAFQAMFVSFARRLHAVHGYGGQALILSAVRYSENQPFEAYMSAQAKGLDVGAPLNVATKVMGGIKTVSWLTAINHDMVKKIGGLDAFRSGLPMDWFAMYDYGDGVVIQAGPKALAAAVTVDPKPATYVLPNMLLKEVRVADIGNLHRVSQDGANRLTGKAAEEWLQRFDVPGDDLLAYKVKLLTESVLTKESTLPDRL